MGEAFVLEINSMASLGEGGSFVKAALTQGYTYATLVRRIVEIAHERYFGAVAPHEAVLLREPTATAGPDAPASGGLRSMQIAV